MSESHERLSQIQTSWTELGLARTEVPANIVADARETLLRRYAGPVYRYLLACVHDEHIADDLAQEFAVRFLDGRFASADRDRGRFRDYLKRAVSNLATDHFRKQAIDNRKLGELKAQQTSVEASNESFDNLWRDEVLKQTWLEFEAECEASGSPLYTVLRHRAEFPDDSASEMAAALQSLVNRKEPLSNDWVRQNLHRARKAFALRLRKEVARTVGGSDPSAIDEELAEIGLLKYCDV